MWPGWATSAATVATFAFGGGDPNVIAIAGLLAIGATLTASPVVYQTVEKLAVPQGRRRPRVPRRRAVRGDQRDRVRGHDRSVVTSFGTFPSEIPIAILVGALAAAGAGGANNLVQSNWIRDKGFGMGKLRAADRLPHHRPGGGGARRASASASRRTRQNLGRWKVWWKRANLEQFVSFALHRRAHDHRLLADRLLDRLQEPGPAGLERLRLHLARGPGARRRRSARGSARCSSPSAPSACSRPRSASSTTSHGWWPTSSTSATRATAQRWSESGLYFAVVWTMVIVRQRDPAARLRPAAGAAHDLDRAGRRDHVRLHVPAAGHEPALPAAGRSQLRGYRIAILVFAFLMLGHHDRDRRRRPVREPAVTRAFTARVLVAVTLWAALVGAAYLVGLT